MKYTNRRATMKWWDTHTKKIQYFPSAKFNAHNSKFGKGWSPGSTLMTRENISALPTLNIDLSDHHFIKYDIFEVIVKFPPMGTPSGMVVHYYDNDNM